MSNLLIQAYFAELDRLKKFSGSLTEGIISEAFKDLLKAWSKQSGLIFLSQYEFESPQKNRIRPDGTIVHELRVPLGYWEAKDTDDDLDKEIAKKLAKGYPQDNIIFENSHTAVLIQNRVEVLRCSMTDPVALGKLVALFFNYERKEIAEFRKAVQQFRADLPAVLDALRAMVDRDNGIITLDSETQLSGVPAEAWSYRLGNRSGLEWILDQHKEKTPKDPTIREKFNNYRFADHKEKVIDLLMRVTRVSVETVAITTAMRDANR